MKYKNITTKTINLNIDKNWVSVSPNEVVELNRQFEGFEIVKDVVKKIKVNKKK